MGAGRPYNASMTTNLETTSSTATANAKTRRQSSNRGTGRRRRSTNYDITRSSKGQHHYEKLRNSQQNLLISIGAGLLIGGLIGFSLGGYYPLTVGTGLALGLAIGILNAS